MIRPALFSDVNIVKIQFFANYNKHMEKAWVPSVASYKRNDEGLFDR